jgi:glycine/D-amino acid oxidase-like deaminating enzyme
MVAPTVPRRIAIVGGGAIGSAIAYFLTQPPEAGSSRYDVTVIERDFTYARASSALSASSIRQQFSTDVNIAMSQFGIDFLRRVDTLLAVGTEAPALGLVEPGYLYLATPAGSRQLRENHAVQKKSGVEVALLAPEALVHRFPWLSTEGIELGSLGLAGEGWFDGYGLMQGLRRKAVAQGARYLQAEARGFERDAAGRITAVLANDPRGSDEPAPIACDVAVNAAGPWAAAVAAWANIPLPVAARRRSVFGFTSPGRLPACPLVIDPSGIWFRPEGDRFICGFAPEGGNDPDEPPLDVEYAAFDERIWPALAHRVPAFEAVRMAGAWAGYYEMNTFDHNAILGAHPACGNLYFAVGFSGHGLQQAPAAGRGIAELIRHGGYRTLDLEALSFARILEGRPLLERNVI